MLANLFAFIVAISILVAVHEFGHFWVARRCGVFVERFSIGFGPVLLSRRDALGTEYVFSAIPLGGYVKMRDEHPQEKTADLEKHPRSGSFNEKSVWARMVIVFAGPLANFLFAWFLFWVMLLIGIVGLKPVVDDVWPNSIAQQAGVKAGSEIVAVNDKKTPTWQTVTYALISQYGQPEAILTLKPSDVSYTQQKTLNLQDWELNPDDASPLSGLGLVPKVAQYSLDIARILDDGAAEDAGLLEGDEIIAVNGERLAHWRDFVRVIQRNPLQSLEVVVERDGKQYVSNLTPQVREQNGREIGYAGLAPVTTPLESEFYHKVQYGVFEAIPVALEKTWSLMKLTFSMIVKLFEGVVPIDNLSGPIAIAQGAGASANYGLVAFLGFLALLSVNLGIINLLPLPVLDGGSLVFLMIEAIRGRPLPLRIQEVVLRVGVALLLTLMLFALFNDFSRL